MNQFKKFIRFFVSLISSREFAFVYCLIGTIAQVSHTFFLTLSISSLSGSFKIMQALLLSVFISSSLLYFVSISDDEKTKESRRVRIGVNIFTFIEIIINLYYYSRFLIIDSSEMRVYDFLFALVISILIPYSIKLYANTIRAKEWLLEDVKTIETDLEQRMEQNLEQKLTQNLEQKLTQKFEQNIDSYLKENLDKSIGTTFKDSSELFLKQFESKVKTLINSNLNQFKPKPS